MNIEEIKTECQDQTTAVTMGLMNIFETPHIADLEPFVPLVHALARLGMEQLDGGLSIIKDFYEEHAIDSTNKHEREAMSWTNSIIIGTLADFRRAIESGDPFA